MASTSVLMKIQDFQLGDEICAQTCYLAVAHNMHATGDEFASQAMLIKSYLIQIVRRFSIRPFINGHQD